MIREAALRTKGSGGPSGVDANVFKRILNCKSFNKSSANLCDALKTMTRKLCTEYIDPRTIEQILANRLIPLDKGEDAVRPIGVVEVFRRVIGKCVMKVTKEYILDVSGSLQVCAGLRSGSEATVHTMHSIFEEDETEEETDAVLLMVCNDVEIEPVLQELTGESLPSGANRAPDARLDIHVRGFWERQRSAFFDVRVCYPNADSYGDLDLKQMYKQHESCTIQ